MDLLNRLGSALVIAALLLVACGPQGGAGPAASPAATAASPAATAAAFDRTATVRLGQPSPSPASWDPIEILTTPSYHTLVYDRLVAMKPDFTIGPQLATSWRFSADGKILDMQLRQNVKFHDGSAFDAKVAKANLDRARTAPTSTVRADMAIIDVVEVVDDHSIRLRLKEQDYAFLYTLATVNGASMMASPAALDTPALKVKPAGSGPFTLASQAQDRAAFDRWEGYWDVESIKAAKLEIVGISDDNARLNALRAGQLDLVAVRTTQYPEVKTLADSKQFTLYSFLPGIPWALLINTKTPGLDKVEVRRALSQAIDRTTINEKLLNGQCRPTQQPFAPGSVGHDPALDAAPMYDPAKAKQLLVNAGVTDLTLRMILRGVQPHDVITEAIQAQFAEIGVKVTFIRTTTAESNATWARGAADASVFQTVVPDSSIQLQRYLMGPTYQLGGPPPDLAPLALEARSLPLDAPQRGQAYQKISRSHVENPTHIFICANAVQWLAKPVVLNADQMPISRIVAVLEPRYVGKARSQ